MFQAFAIENGILLVVSLALFVLKAFAFIDALTRPRGAYVAADKQQKPFWLLLLGIFLVAHMIFWSPLSLLNLIGTVAALVYVLDARPALRSITRR